MIKSTLRIDQFLPSFTCYDAISNESKLLQKFLRSKGYQSDIFVDENHRESGTKKFSQYSSYYDPKNIMINHFSIGTSLNFELSQFKSFKITRFHHITPPDFLLNAGMEYTRNQCLLGYSQIPLVKRNTDYYWATSFYNEFFLKKHAFVKGEVVPVLRNYADLLNKKIEASLAEKMVKNKRIKIIFVGRVTPHKGQANLILLMKRLKDFLPVPCQLVITGKQDPSYTENVILKMARDLGLSVEKNLKSNSLDKDILLFNSVTEEELATLYYYSDIFCSLSDHEGFGVPYVEAMSFNLPIITQPIEAALEICGDVAFYVDGQAIDDETFFSIKNMILDPGIRKIGAYKSRAQAKKFGWEKIQEKLEKSFNTLLKIYEKTI